MSLPIRRPKEVTSKLLLQMVEYFEAMKRDLDDDDDPCIEFQSLDLYKHIHKHWLPKTRYDYDYQSLIVLAEYIHDGIHQDLSDIQNSSVSSAMRGTIMALQSLFSMDELDNFYMVSCVIRTAQNGGHVEVDATEKDHLREYLDHFITSTKLVLRALYNITV